MIKTENYLLFSFKDKYKFYGPKMQFMPRTPQTYLHKLHINILEFIILHAYKLIKPPITLLVHFWICFQILNALNKGQGNIITDK